MEKQKSIVQFAFEKQIKDLEAKVNGLEIVSFEGFCDISNNIRTSFFMMEALCRVYSKIHGDKPFIKWLNKCKMLEDKLGELDFYHNEILPNTTDEKEEDVIKNKIQTIYKNIFSILKEDEWISGKRGRKMKEKLTTLEFKKEKEEIEGFLKKEIDKIIDFHQTISYENMEDHVHEIRRKVRWISIYSQCINGLIQLKKVVVATEKNEVYKKYLTAEVLSSKFNILPPPIHGEENIYFNQDAFYAMSWLINELGTIKDEGLLIEYRKEKSKELDKLLQRAKEICTVFIEKDNILQNLIVK